MHCLGCFITPRVNKASSSPFEEISLDSVSYWGKWFVNLSKTARVKPPLHTNEPFAYGKQGQLQCHLSTQQAHWSRTLGCRLWRPLRSLAARKGKSKSRFGSKKKMKLIKGCIIDEVKYQLHWRSESCLMSIAIDCIKIYSLYGGVLKFLENTL